ncbi:WYL domain-containing protein [Nostoc sp.]|uniref:WYL domain-containing protein n=1 Tax=Nostoc sp. TaxID=1180 RepID=UPI002FF10306
MSAICHFLIGVPGSGKSTLANYWCQQDPNLIVVSTDAIRAEFFGDEQIQGEWQLIETTVLNRVKTAIASGHSVVYDATNAKRAWRIDILQKFASVGADTWIGWYLKVPLKECYRRNRQRQRQVDKNVIASFAQLLNQFAPIEAEGFAKVTEVKMVNGKHNTPAISTQIENLPRSIANRHNFHRKKILHQYSQLLDFERLMYLISLLIQYPGVGLLHITNPNYLQKILGDITGITDSIDEIAALMSRRYHPIYADSAAIAKDLEWLEKNGIIGEQGLDCEIYVSDYTGDIKTFEAHTYSDIDLFVRLIKIIRCLVHYPCFRYEEESEQKTQEIFWESLRSRIYGLSQSQLRKDIQRVLHPYKILPNTAMKRAYFVGNAILAKHELAEVYRVLRSHVQELQDPIALSTYEALEKKLELSQIMDSQHFAQSYPVRAIANQPIVDLNTLPDYAAHKKLDELTEAILSGRALELDRLLGTGRHLDDPHANQPFSIWPLQIVFSNIGWYLGYECLGGDNNKLLKFERLDRIFINKILPDTRGIDKQKQALLRLEKLYKSSYSLFLGNSPEDQQKYLDTKQRASVEIVLEIWCKPAIFNFISEGTKRLPSNQIKMSKRPGVSYKADKIFVLPETKDPLFRYCCQMTLPRWSIHDFELKRWIVGFGDNIKVIKPIEIVEQIKLMGDVISQVYQ